MTKTQGMTPSDLCHIPPALDRTKGVTYVTIVDDVRKRKNAAPKSRGANIKMPAYRNNPARQNKAIRRRTDPTALKRDDKDGPVTHPTTEAVKSATAGMTNGEKRSALYAIARENNIDPHRWDHVNNGQVSMNLTNVLRGRYYKMQQVFIKGQEIE